MHLDYFISQVTRSAASLIFTTTTFDCEHASYVTVLCCRTFSKNKLESERKGYGQSAAPRRRRLAALPSVTENKCYLKKFQCSCPVMHCALNV